MRGGHLSSRSDARHPANQLRTALFVDFDNIYIALRDQDEEAADRFRSNPNEWVRWLERQLPEEYRELTEAERRRILIRRVYANPRTIGSYRPHFVRAGFEVIDTPPLTSQGKTSADIHMVIDMLDALAHTTHFDEFLICSGDADFTPVLLRLRKCDRRTAVLSIGPAAGAYTAACDLSISEDTFLDEALLPNYRTSPRRGRRTPERTRTADEPTVDRSKVLHRIEDRLFEEVGLRGGVEAHELIGIYKDFPEFTAGQNWLEFYSLRAMTEAVVNTKSRLEIIDDDQWWVGLVEAEVDGEPDAPSTERDDEVAEQVRLRIGEADHPVSLAAVGQGLMSDLGDWVKGRWQRAGSLKTYLEELDLGGLEIAAVGPGWLYDPDRHQPPERGGGEAGGPRHGDLPEIGQKVCNLTDTPPLTSEEYGVLLRELEKEVNENGYHISQTSKAVRDRLNGKGLRIARSQVSFILKGLAYSGFRFVQGDVSAYVVGDQLVNNTLHLLSRIQVSLDDEEKEDLYDWMTSEIPPSPDDPEEWEDDGTWVDDEEGHLEDEAEDEAEDDDDDDETGEYDDFDDEDFDDDDYDEDEDLDEEEDDEEDEHEELDDSRS